MFEAEPKGSSIGLSLEYVPFFRSSLDKNKKNLTKTRRRIAYLKNKKRMKMCYYSSSLVNRCGRVGKHEVAGWRWLRRRDGRRRMRKKMT